MERFKKYLYTIPISQKEAASMTFEELDKLIKQNLLKPNDVEKGYEQVGDYRFVIRTLSEEEQCYITFENKIGCGKVWNYKYELVFRRILSKRDKDIVKMVIDYLESIEDDIDYQSCLSIRNNIKDEFGIE